MPSRLTCLNVYYSCNSFIKSNHDGEEEEVVRSEYLTDELSGRRQHLLTSPCNVQCLCLEQSGFHDARKIRESVVSLELLLCPKPILFFPDRSESISEVTEICILLKVPVLNLLHPHHTRFENDSLPACSRQAAQVLPGEMK